MLLQFQVLGFMLLQEASPAISFDVRSMLHQMSWLAIAVVVALFIM